MISGRTFSTTDAHRGGIAQIGLIERRLRVHLMALAGREIVEHRHFARAGRDQRIHRVRADKAGAAGHQNSHRSVLVLNRVAPDRVVSQLERLHQIWIIQVPAVEYHRLLQLGLDALKIGMPELVPLGQNQQRVGILRAPRSWSCGR